MVTQVQTSFMKSETSNKTSGHFEQTHPRHLTSIFSNFISHDVRNESWELLLDLAQRAEQVREVCRTRQFPGMITGLFQHEPSRVTYCFLPKVGCTFWIRVFSYLHNYTGDSDSVHSPWELSRLKIHNNPHSHGVSWSQVENQARNFLRFMFVRHPFSRLWSAYLDKLYLPDFWLEMGVPAVKILRGGNASILAQRCGHDVSFREFVEFSLTVREPHWEPIYLRCDPCQFQPSVVGKMETFARDSMFVLRRMGLEWVLEGVDKRKQEEKELTTLIDYNFEIIHSRAFFQGCVDDIKLSVLLWKTFQMNGYIHRNVQIGSRLSSPGSFTVENFKNHVIDVFRASARMQGELKKQKHDFLQEAFQTLPGELLQKVKLKYKPDMLYFGFTDNNYWCCRKLN